MPELTVVVEQCLAPVPGGTGRYTREITAALAAQSPPGWTVRTVSAFHRQLGPAIIGGADGPHRLPASRRLLSELWRQGLPPSVGGAALHATTPLAPHRRNGMVVTVHDAVPWTHPETLTARGVRWHRQLIARAACIADAIVVPSLAVADDLRGIFPAVASRTHVVGHGVTTLDPPPDAPARRLSYGLPDRYVLCIATLEPRKGLDVLIRAMAHPGTSSVSLAIVGSPGWGGVDIGSVANSAGVSPERVHVLGAIGDVDLAAVLAGASVVAVPSLTEGFGLPALEAMAAGIPVVCSDAPALVELVADAGIVVGRSDSVALAEALSEVVNDSAVAAELGAAGRRRSQLYKWSDAARKLWVLHAGLDSNTPTDVPHS